MGGSSPSCGDVSKRSQLIHERLWEAFEILYFDQLDRHVSQTQTWPNIATDMLLFGLCSMYNVEKSRKEFFINSDADKYLQVAINLSFDFHAPNGPNNHRRP
jgi:hypothetical protein